MQATGAGQRHAGLTRLRFFLIGWVILYHLNLPLHVADTWTWLRPVLGRGYLGVDGFFLLSGFALWLGYGARPPQGVAGIARFLQRRVAKIWPLHLVALLALALLVGLAGVLGITIQQPERFGARDFVLQLLLVHGWGLTDRFAWNYPSWALSVEWAGYLAFPALLSGLRRLPRPVLPLLPPACLLGLVLLAGQGSFGSLNYTLDLGLVRFGLEFALGLGLGRIVTERQVPRGIALAALLGLPAGLWLQQDSLTVLGLAAAIIALWQSGATPATAARPDLLLRLGEASFGIYLSWVFVEAGVVGLLRLLQPGPGGRAALMAGGFAATLAVGWCAWRWVEVPAHRWLLRRREAGVPLGIARPAAE